MYLQLHIPTYVSQFCNLKVLKTLEEILNLENLPAEKHENVLQRIDTLRSSGTTTTTGFAKSSTSQNKLPAKVKFSPHPIYPNFSSCVDIQFEVERGRFGVASRDIEVGEVIIFEAPVGSKLRNRYSGDHCDNCMRYQDCQLQTRWYRYLIFSLFLENATEPICLVQNVRPFDIAQTDV